MTTIVTWTELAGTDPQSPAGIVRRLRVAKRYDRYDEQLLEDAATCIEQLFFKAVQ